MEKKIALITGATRGIGQAIAIELGKCGFIVVGTATSTAGIDKITQSFSDNNIVGKAIICDVTSDSSIGELFKSIANSFNQGVSILVNNAGITADNLFLRMTWQQWHSIIDTNLNSIYRMCNLGVKYMVKQRWGRIINISSVIGSIGNSGQVNYAAAKSGINGFTRSLAAELGKRNITVNSVSPGFINTDMTAALSDKQNALLLEGIPLNRLGEVTDVAKTVSFLASDAASYISGQNIHINGGMYMA